MSESFLLLSRLTDSSLESIEVISGAGLEDSSNAIHPFLMEEGHLGIPEKVLYRLYTEAVGIFTAARRISRKQNPLTSEASASLRMSSAIILLANPAHQTALNYRKKLVASGILSTTNELDFMAAMLQGSRECAKQSIIWDHRRWLFKYIYSCSIAPSTNLVWCSEEELFPCIPLDIIHKELAILSRCCDVYPRNYHAWCHWQFCIRCIYISKPPDKTAVIGEILRLHQWTQRHISDFTSMHYLILLSSRENMLLDTFDRATSLVKLYPQHESLWMYLRWSFALMDAGYRQGKAGEIRELGESYSGKDYGRSLQAWNRRIYNSVQ